MSEPPEDLFNRAALRQLAGENAFGVGEDLLRTGAVRQMQVSADRVSAKVSDDGAFRVKLWRGRGELQFSCTCDRGEAQEFCEHCAAVGLAWLAGPQGQQPKPGVTRDELRDHLRSLDKERLVSLALEATDYDDILRRRLMLEAIGVARPSKSGAEADYAAYRQILREAIECADYVDYEAMADYAQGVEEAIRPMGEMLRNGQAAAVVELAEFALVELDKASSMIDGGDGSMNTAFDDLQHYHLEACRLAHLDPEALAARLLEYEIEGGLSVFNNCLAVYADALGPLGKMAWRRSLTQKWEAIPEVSSGEIDHRRFQINALMERLAIEDGDSQALAAIRQREMNSAHDCLALAEAHRAAGRIEQAIASAEKGLELPSASDIGLRDLLIALYPQAGRGAEAVQMAWKQFETARDLESFEQLKNAAGDSWQDWRDRALATLEESAGGSTAVEAILNEGLVERALEQARRGGASVRLWLALADRQAFEAPAEALKIYQQQLDVIISGGDQRAYRRAIDVLAKIRRLLETLGRREDFGALSAEVRAAHRQKRNFLKLLDGMR